MTRHLRAWGFVLAAVLGASLALLAAPGASAHGSVDQQKTLADTGTVQACPTPGWDGQTFTPTQTNLVGFDLIFHGAGTFAYKIRNWTTGQDLATGGPVSVASGVWVHFDLAEPVPLTPGFKYAILRTGGTVPNFRCEPDAYAGGAIVNGSSEYSPTDLPFATYYDPDLPPPTCGGADASIENTCTYSYTALEDRFVVPEHVNSIHVVAIGGKGGSILAGSSGGFGAQVTVDIPVTPGTPLYVEVAGNGGNQVCSGCPGAGGFNGGGNGTYSPPGVLGSAGGGGASDLRTASRTTAGSLDTRLVVAAGGGGSGGKDANLVNGGAGGAAGANGSGGTYAGGGFAGSASAGGSGGAGGGTVTFGNPGGPGAQGLGGSGGFPNGNGGAGGGGGAGYFGGGGGGGGGYDSGGYGSGAGGGGGSSYPSSATIEADTTGIPKITITWTVILDEDPPDVDVSFDSPDGNNGWFITSPVVGTVTADDSANGGSTISAISCTGATVSETITGLDTTSASAAITVSEEGTTDVSCTATDSAANSGAGTGSNNAATVKIDTTKPVITADGNGYTPDTWTNQSVAVDFACADAGGVQSGIATDTVAGDTVSTEGADQGVTNTGDCVDNAGNAADSSTFNPIKIDTTAPTLVIGSVSSPLDGFMPAQTFTSPASSFPVTVGASPLGSTGTAGDGGSGIASVTVNSSPAAGTTSWSKIGITLVGSGSTAIVQATDQAGNSSSALAATLDPDLDDDGIANDVDGNSTVVPSVGQATVSSTRFSDKQLGGQTSGQVKSKAAGATISITDDPTGGLVVVVGGTGQAKFTLDGKGGTTTIAAPGSGVLGDPPATTVLEMLSGSGEIEYIVNGETVVVSVGTGATAMVTETYTNGTLTGLTVSAPNSPPGAVTVNDTPVGSASLSAKLDLSATKFALNATFTLGAGGVITLPEQFVLDVGSFSATIPTSSFKKNKQGYAFSRTVNGVSLSGLISRISSTQYRVQITGSGVNNIGSTNPITVSVAIGDDTGVAVVKAKLT